MELFGMSNEEEGNGVDMGIYKLQVLYQPTLPPYLSPFGGTTSEQ